MQLKRNIDFWSFLLTNRSSIGNKHGVNSDLILLGHNTDLLIADYGKTYDKKPLHFVDGRSTPHHISIQGRANMSLVWDVLERRVASSHLQATLFMMGDDREGDVVHLAIPSLRAWYTNNRAVVHPKLVTYPRGVQQTFLWEERLRGSTTQVNRTKKQL